MRVLSAYVEVTPQLAAGSAAKLNAQASRVGSEFGDTAGRSMGAPLNKHAAKAGADAGKASAAQFGAAFKAGLLLVGAAAAAGLFKAVQGASDLNEEVSKARVIFGDQAKAIEQFSKTAEKSLGQSRVEALNGASTFALYAKQASLTGDQVTNFSTKMVTLASDMASFSNTSPAEAIQAIGAAFRGESDPIEKYGVLLNESVLKNKALELGIVQTTKEALTPQQRVLAAQAAILEQTSAAQGDFARTSGGLANQQRILSATTKNVAADLGGFFLPAALAVVSALNEHLVPSLKTTGEWLQQNSSWLAPLAVGLGTAAIAVGVWAAALKVAAVAQGLLNLAMTANPIGLIVVAVAALAAGLIYAYKHSETFRDIVDNTWKVIQEAVMSAWAFIEPIFQQWLVFAKSMADVYLWLWKNVMEPVWAGITAVISGWWSFVQNVWKAVTGATDNLGIVFRSLGSVLSYVFVSIQTTAQVMWAALQVVFGVMQVTFQVLAAAWKLVYDTVIAPVISGIGAMFKATYDNVILPVWNSIKVVFNAFGSVLKDYVAPAFEAGVKAIGSAWDKIKDMAASPVKFVLETVLNDGLLKAYNKIADLFGVKPDNVQVPIPKFAAGGPVSSAAGARGADSVLAAVMPDEHVLTRNDVRNLGGHQGVHKLRQAAAQGSVPHFAGGGSVPTLLQIMNKSGIPHSVNSTYRSTNDFHGQGLAVDFGGSGNGAVRDRIADYWQQYSGSLLELIHRSDDGRRNWAVKRGQNVGPGYYGEGTMNEHRNHVHVAATQAAALAISKGASPAQIGGDPENPGSGMLDDLGSLASGLISKIPGGKYPRDIAGGVVGKIAGTLVSKAKDFMSSLPVVGGMFGGDEDFASRTGSPQDYAMKQLSRYGWGDDQFAPLNKLWNKESGWNYKATNPSSGAYGIPQSLPGSKMASAGADWRTNPQTQINWGLNYIKGRYGSPAAAWDHSARTDWYDSGGDLMPGTSLVHNGTGKVESVVTEQWKKDLLTAIGGLAAGGGGGVTIENVNVTDRADVDMLVNQLEWRLSGV